MKGKREQKYDTLMIDEAGQCLEPLAWCIFPMAERYVLAGDPFQLPPTVLSPEATKLGLSMSILEQSFRHMPNIFLLNTQYRMRENIAGFSSRWFYENRLQTAPHLQVAGKHLIFYDTAGYDAPEERGQDGSSLQNAAELRLMQEIITVENLPPGERAFISPYAGQVLLAKEHLGQMRISTIDSFQGQEAETILLSLVRSNDGGDIGFLKDYRRMNVAITRAKQAMIVIGDSSTLARDPFYDAFIQYIQTHGEYKSVWELET
jgi:superfamily I DNA and/or RNA helicase